LEKEEETSRVVNCVAVKTHKKPTTGDFFNG
jgi:hypothetical protein